jgi:peptidoglycan/LPS O-acetylase OafA/YrhL
MAGLVVGSLLPGGRSRIVAMASRLNYEFYLVHGPIYLGLARFFNLGLYQNLVIGTSLAIMGACLLRLISQKLHSALMDLFAPTSASASPMGPVWPDPSTDHTVPAYTSCTAIPPRISS